jgi:hypothetical protein
VGQISVFWVCRKLVSEYLDRVCHIAVSRSFLNDFELNFKYNCFSCLRKDFTKKKLQIDDMGNAIHISYVFDMHLVIVIKIIRKSCQSCESLFEFFEKLQNNLNVMHRGISKTTNIIHVTSC